MSKLDIILLDNLNNKKDEVNIIKPKTYQEFLEQLKQGIKNLPQNYDLIILDKDNKEIKINNEVEYKTIDDILFIREIKTGAILELDESDQDFYGEKYSCAICNQIIEGGKPYLCYKCQKIFHEKCFKSWCDKCKEKQRQTSCPNCRNELSLENWNKQTEFERDKENFCAMMGKIKEEKIKNNMNNNLIIIKDKKIEELKSDNIKQAELIKKYENYMEKTFQTFKNILSKMNFMHSSLKSENNNKLNDLINNYPLNLENLNLDNISNIIDEELAYLKNNQINNKNNINNNEINNNQFNPMQMPIFSFNFQNPENVTNPQFSQFSMFPPETAQGDFWNITFEKKEELQIRNDNTVMMAYYLSNAKALDKNMNLKFTFNGNILDPNAKLNQSGLHDNSIIHVGPVLKDKIILLFEVREFNQTLGIEISPDINFSYVMELIKIKSHIKERVFFIFNGQSLNGELTIKKAGLKNYSKIIVIIERLIG